jgi:hypothetical protein
MGSRGIAPRILNSALQSRMVSFTPRPLHPLGSSHRYSLGKRLVDQRRRDICLAPAGNWTPVVQPVAIPTELSRSSLRGCGKPKNKPRVSGARVLTATRRWCMIMSAAYEGNRIYSACLFAMLAPLLHVNGKSSVLHTKYLNLIRGSKPLRQGDRCRTTSQPATNFGILYHHPPFPENEVKQFIHNIQPWLNFIPLGANIAVFIYIPSWCRIKSWKGQN